MGQSNSNSYQSKESQIFEKLGKNMFNQKQKRDGSVLRSKKDIIASYDQSSVPSPLRELVNLDYCWRLNYTMFKHSMYFGVPLTMVIHMWTNLDKVWKYSIKSAPYKKIVLTYSSVILLVNLANTSWSLIFDEYCNRNSPIYDPHRTAYQIRRIINDTNQKHMNTIDGQSHQTLTEEEILNEKKSGNIL